MRGWLSHPLRRVALLPLRSAVGDAWPRRRRSLRYGLPRLASRRNDAAWQHYLRARCVQTVLRRDAFSGIGRTAIISSSRRIPKRQRLDQRGEDYGWTPRPGSS